MRRRFILPHTADNPYSLLVIDDGLPADAYISRYQKRRQVLLAKLNHIVVIFGFSKPSFFLASPVYQDSHFLFYTGINQLNSILLLDPNSTSDSEVLFLPSRDPNNEFWNGEMLGVGNRDSVALAQEKTGIRDIRNHRDFYKVLMERMSKQKAKGSGLIGVFWSENKAGKIKKNFHYERLLQLRRYLRRQYSNSFEIVNIQNQVWQQRLKADEPDQKNSLVANQKAAEAFKIVLKHLSIYQSETEIHGSLNGELLKRTPFGISFPSIIACGRSAATLHYWKHDEPLRKNELVLLDFGIWWHSMACDISRTVPINGVYNPLQRLLYQIVLDTQCYVEKQVRPGITIEKLNQKCWSFLKELLNVRFFSYGGKARFPYKEFPHFVSHLLGRQVHDGDPFRNYKKQALVPGNIISNEPGLYGYFEIKLNRIFYQETIGIRIEDDLVITETGCKNLSQSCPKRIDEIEKMSYSPQQVSEESV